MSNKQQYQRRWLLARHEFKIIAASMVIVVAVVFVGGSAIGARQQAGRDDFTLPGRFGRMFQGPPFAPPTPEVTAALLTLGRRGGILDARDDLAAGPILLIVDPSRSLNNPDNDTQTAGTTFMGQFLDHDMTFDTTSRLGEPTNPIIAPNSRRPAFDLDSVYGDGPIGSPHLYDPTDRIKLLVENGGRFEDLPRDQAGRAILTDPRNDENLIIASLHAAFLLFHNNAVNLVRLETPSLSNDEAFARARRLVTWHYQWMILHEFLPHFVGQWMVDDILQNGRRFYTPRNDNAFIPVEFQMAYRFGHSMVRPSYRANFTGNSGQPFFAMVFAPSQGPDPEDLRGGVRSPRRFIGWQTFFRFPGFEDDVRPNKLIDTKISTPLFDLPLGAIPAGSPPTSLPQRNLLRHLTWLIPSGQTIAAAIGAPVLRPDDLSELQPIHPSFVTSTPLWYYVLKEAELMEGGLRLGPVGGRIVGEVFIGLLQSDLDSYVNARPDFRPMLGPIPGEFRMIDFLTFAGVADKR